MMVLEDHRASRWLYRCGRDRRLRKTTCDLGELTAWKVDEAAALAIEAALTEPETVIRLVRKGIERSASPAPSSREIGRKLVLLANLRVRIVYAYESGGIDLPEVRKRVAGIDAERHAIELVMEPASAPAIEASKSLGSNWGDAEHPTGLRSDALTRIPPLRHGAIPGLVGALAQR